ncbi:Hypothetical predicted protein [Cloeon dipterum]|uniref:Uncharacterized protein n=1 Tax=Cloeon dipterum TaxID=197152 RepID=A0A8S1CGL3_9INSE|nr:Hypothetical predicted protein [Cloeon dipterum]
MDPKVLCRPHISTKMTNLILKHTFGQHQQVNQLNAHGSFLLAQLLPFQPDLLFQWLAFTMRCLLMFELEMEEIYTMPVPVEFKPHLMSLHKSY